MPALLPPPMPLFSCSSIRTVGKRSRPSARLPSAEPWSTTTTSCPLTDSRQRSSHGSALNVTTTTVTLSSGAAIGNRRAPNEHVLLEDEGDSGHGEQHGHDEEEEPAGECRVCVDAELAEEADEERLAHTEPVDGERHQHHQEEQWPEHDERQRRQPDSDRPRRGVDRHHARQLQAKR